MLGDVFVGFIEKLCNTFIGKKIDKKAKFEDTQIGQRMAMTIKGLGKTKTMVDEFGKVMGKLLDIVKKYDGQIKPEQIDGLYAALTNFVKDKHLVSIQRLGTYKLDKTIDFMKDMSKIGDYLNQIDDNLKDMNHVVQSCVTLVTCMEIFDEKRTLFKNIDKDDISNVIPFMKIAVRISEDMKQLQEINNSEMTEAILQFIRNIEILTDTSVEKRTQKSRQSLVKFYTDLK